MSILHPTRQILYFVKQQNATTTGQSLLGTKTTDTDFSRRLTNTSLKTLKSQAHKAYNGPASSTIQNAPGISGVAFPRLTNSRDHCVLLTKADISRNIYGPHFNKSIIKKYAY